jgi:hypothetical protein
MKKSQAQSEKFDKWYNGYFLASRNPTSPLLVGENKQVKAKFLRIEVVCQMILESPKVDLQTLRKMVAVRFFISMRCALDYINYANIVLEEYRKTYK